jgi:hypothetical protein
MSCMYREPPLCSQRSVKRLASMRCHLGDQLVRALDRYYCTSWLDIMLTQELTRFLCCAHIEPPGDKTVYSPWSCTDVGDELVCPVATWETSLYVQWPHGRPACMSSDHMGDQLVCPVTIWETSLYVQWPYGRPACISSDHMGDQLVCPVATWETSLALYRRLGQCGNKVSPSTYEAVSVNHISLCKSCSEQMKIDRLNWFMWVDWMLHTWWVMSSSCVQ